MQELPSAESPDRPVRSRLVLLSIALALLAIAPLSLWPASRYGGVAKLLRVANGGPVTPEDDRRGVPGIAAVYYDWQYTVLVAIVLLTLAATAGVYPILGRLMTTRLARILIGAEVGLVFWAVYGGLSEIGMPGLFWNADPLSQGFAGAGVTLFWFWMLYLLFIPDYEAHRHAPERQVWTRFQPVLTRSGVPAWLGFDTATASGAARLGWFLAYAGLPGVVLLALPAVLPAARPGYLASIVAAPWLAGMAVGLGVVFLAVRWRVATRLHVVWQQLLSRRIDLRQLRDPDPDRLDPHANTKNILIVLVAVFVVSYLAPSGVRRFFPPAFSLCVLLGVAATTATWLETRSPRMRAAIGVAGLFLVAMAGVLDYEVILDDLRDRYPPAYAQIVRRLVGDGTRPETYAGVYDLASYQRSYRRKADADAYEHRERILDHWSLTLRSEHITQEPASKPILVVVTTSGGALRAALWTQTVLRTLDRAIPAFHRHVRLITGASGGMLGAAAYVAAHHSHAGAGGSRLLSDYLTPIAWQIAFRDVIPNAVAPVATYNRGDALVSAWLEHAPGLSLTFAELAPEEEAGRIPSLAFSPMLVEDGRRLLISNLPLDDLTSNTGRALIEADRKVLAAAYKKRDGKGLAVPDDYDLEFPNLASVSAVDFFHLLRGEGRDRLRLASAVRMSATFPYVTSVVTLPTYPPRHVVDAGYYDNYGVNLASAWISSHRHWLRDHVAGVLVVQIRAFRNEKRLKILDESIRSVAAPVAFQGVLDNLKRRGLALVRFLPASVAMLREGLSALMIPVEGVARARESSMFFRNDEQLLALHHVFEDLTGEDDFFRTVIFTCDTLQVGRSTQNVETLNWYIDPDERYQVERNMEPVSRTAQTGRVRNSERLEGLLKWWHARGGRTSPTGRHRTRGTSTPAP